VLLNKEADRTVLYLHLKSCDQNYFATFADCTKTTADQIPATSNTEKETTLVDLQC